MQSHKQKLEAELKSGNLPAFMKEEEMIIEGTDYDRYAIDYIRKIIDRLLPKQLEKNKQLKIYISAAPEANAYVIPSATPPIMVVTKGLLELAKTEDELAGVLAHELMHIELHDQFPDHCNSKVEESLCDFKSIELLDQAGYQRDGLIALGERFPKQDTPNVFGRLLDPHPSWQMRAKNLGIQLAIYERDHGLKKNKQTTPLELFIEEKKGSKITWPSYLQIKLNALHYEKKATHEKLAILADIIESEKIIFEKENKTYYSRRIEAIGSEIIKLKINIKNPQEEKAFGKLIDALLNYSNESSLLASAYHAIGHTSPYTAFGTMKEFQTLGKQFVAASNEKETAAIASRLNELVKQHPMLFDNLRLFDLTFFKLPKLKGPFSLFSSSSYEIPWNKHLEWSKKDRHIRETLKTLGILYVVKTYYPQEDLDALGYSLDDIGHFNDQKIKLTARNDIRGYLTEDLEGEFKEGTYTAKKAVVIKKGIDLLAQEEIDLKKKDEDEEKMPVDWSLLEEKGQDAGLLGLLSHPFVTKYKNQLCMECTMTEGGFAFAKRVMDKIKEIELKDRSKADNLIMLILDLPIIGQKKESEFAHGVSVNHPFVQHVFKNYKRFEFGLVGKSILFYNDKAVAKKLEQRKHAGESKLATLESRWRFPEYEIIFDLKKDIDNLLKFKKVGPYLQIPSLWIYHALRILQLNSKLHLTSDQYAYLTFTFNENIISSGPHNKELNNAFGNALHLCEQTFFQDSLEEKNLQEVIRRYHIMIATGNIFKEYKNIYHYQDKIKSVFKALKGTDDKLAFLEDLIVSHPVNFESKYYLKSINSNFNFVDPSFKNWVINEYTKVLSEIIGIDKGEQKADKPLKIDIKAKVQELLQKVPFSVSIPVLREVANNIQAQKSLSFFMRDQIERATKQDLLKKGIYLGGLGEILITVIPKCQDKSIVTDTIAFLLGGNDFNYDRYIKKLINDSYLQVSIDFADVYSLLNKYASNKENTIDFLQSIQKFFRDLSFEQQILVIDQLLFPAEQSKSLEKGKQFVLDAIFDSSATAVMKMIANVLTQNSLNTRQNDKEARQVVESYLEALEEVAKDPNHRISIQSREKLMLAAMLVANAKSQQSKDKVTGRGEALRQVLDAMGPAGRKLAQAIESHTETPEDIKTALKSSKTNAAPPARWEVHEWVEQFYQPTGPDLKLFDGIQSLGEMLGAGSYGVTMRAVKQSGAETAITFLRPHMREQAEDEFMILEKASKILIKKNSDFKPFDDMQKEASAASVLEVNMGIAYLQQKIAEKLYSKLEIRINDLTFKFGVAGWIGSGEHYKETLVIKGHHFNDLDKSPEFKNIKKETAQALLAAELFLLLSGGPIDNDRHGGQQKIIKTKNNEVYIGNFDFGGMALLSQTEWQKQLLGSLVGEAMWESAKPIGARKLDGSLLGDLSEKYVNLYAKQNFKDNEGKESLIGLENAKRFVGRLKRGLLALGNYLSELKDEPERLKVVLGAVLATGQIDKTIEQAIREKLGMFQGKLDELTRSKEVKQFRINRL